MAFIAILAMVECFESQITAIVESSQAIRVHLGSYEHNNTFWRQFCQELRGERRILMLETTSCQYSSLSSEDNVIFRNASCQVIGSSFFLLHVHYPEQDFKQTLTITRILTLKTSLATCYQHADLRYDVSDIYLNYKFDCAVQITGNVSLMLSDKNGNVLLQEFLPDLSAGEGTIEFTSQTSLIDLMHSIDNSLLCLDVMFTLLFKQDEKDIATSTTVEHSLPYAYSYRELLYDRSQISLDCLGSLTLTWLDNRILLQQTAGPMICDSSKVEIITIEFPEDGALRSYNIQNYSFEFPEYFINDTGLIMPKSDRIVVGFLNGTKSSNFFSYRIMATASRRMMDGFVLHIRDNEFCVSASVQNGSNGQVRRYVLDIDLTSTSRQYELTEFYPLAEYCFHEPDREIILRYASDGGLAIFKIDDHEVYSITQSEIEMRYTGKYQDYLIIIGCFGLFILVVLLAGRTYNGF